MPWRRPIAVCYSFETERPVCDATAGQFQVQAQMFMALYPRTGEPWLFGLHQCSHPRQWTPQERLLFKEIGRRVTDGLSSMLFLRDLRESESNLREAQQMARLGHWVWDVKTGDVEWSEEVYRIFRLDPQEFKPQIDSIMALSPWPDTNARHKELIQRAIASREQRSFEQRFLRPDESTGYYYSTFRGIYDGNGELAAIRGDGAGHYGAQTHRRRTREVDRQARSPEHRIGTVHLHRLPRPEKPPDYH